MARSQNSFIKKVKEEKRKKKQDEKFKKKIDRKNKPTGDFKDMLAYVDENGNITSTPPEDNQ